MSLLCELAPPSAGLALVLPLHAQRQGDQEREVGWLGQTLPRKVVPHLGDLSQDHGC